MSELQRIAMLLCEADTIALIPHTSPDADTLGSCFAVMRMLEQLGKRATVYADEPTPSYLTFLNGHSVVYAGEAVTCDVCLCIDCGDLERISTRLPVFESATHTASIDHHYTNTSFAALNCIDGEASSTGELCCELRQLLGVPMDRQIATCLYAAITADTGGFRYSNTTPAALRSAAELLEAGIDVWKINRMIFDTVSIEKMRLKGMIAQNVRLYADGLIAVVEATKEMIELSGAKSEEVSNIVDIARQIAGTEVAVSFKEGVEGIKVSMRSNEYIDVGAVATRFGGGGHKRAAGLTINAALPEAEAQIIAALEECIVRHTHGQTG